MRFVLMHKSIMVATLGIDDKTGVIRKVYEVFKPEHLPCGVNVRKGVCDRAALNAWWVDRSIPASRLGVEKALSVLNVSDTKLLLLRCFGLSLSDQYWIKPKSSEIKWEDVNFFDNAFSEDIGDVLLGKTTKIEGFDFHSPDNTSDGFLKKRWKIINGKRYLMKSGSNPFMQQPFNEVLATIIAQRLGINHVEYELIWDDGVPFSICEDFINRDTELVSAWRIMQSTPKDNNTSVYKHYIDCCKNLGIDDIVSETDKMVVLDYIIANEDRHQNNFGLVRNANTLEWIGVAPVYDSGSSFGYDKITNQIIYGNDIECKPFKKKHEDQIKLVSSFGWIDFNAFKGLEEEMYGVLDKAGDFLDDTRKDAIVKSTIRRIEELKIFAQESVVKDDLSDDVKKNVSAKYND